MRTTGAAGGGVVAGGDPEIAAIAACIRVEDAEPAPSPLRRPVFPQSIAERRCATRGVSGVGLASRCHDVKGHVPLQALERESNPRQSD